MYSMTGYGQTHGKVGPFDCDIQIRSVNHRFLDIRTRISPPADTPHIEHTISQILRKYVHRGSLQIVVQLQPEPSSGTSSFGVNLNLCIEYGTAWSSVSKQCHAILTSDCSGKNTVDPIELQAMTSFVASQKDVLVKHYMQRLSIEGEAALGLLLERAAEDLVKQRTREGAALAEAICTQLSGIRTAAQEIHKLSKDAPHRFHRKLCEKIEMLLPQGTQPIDPQRIAQEIALLASHADIEEELVRLQVHLDEMDRLCQTNEPIGKQLEFLIQEIHREVNTLGSKSHQLEISHHLIHMKTFAERLREQVQNVE